MTEAKPLKVKSTFLIATLLLLVFGGVAIALAMLAQDKAEQNQTLAKAEQLADSAGDAGKAPNLEALKTSQRQLKESITILESIPRSAGSAYQQAQTDLPEVRSRLDSIEQQLENEQAAFSILANAEKLAKEANNISRDPPHSAVVWRAAQAKWQSAIKLLEKVPTNTFASTQAKQNVSAYRSKYRTINQNLKTEEAALATLKEAQALATQASNIGTVPRNTTDLRKDQEKLLQAISLLQKLPTNTDVYAEGKENLATYVNQRNFINQLSTITNQLQNQNKQIKLFVFESTWLDLASEKQAQLRTLSSQARGDQTKFVRECAVKYQDRPLKTKLKGESSELSDPKSFYNELCRYMWTKL